MRTGKSDGKRLSAFKPTGLLAFRAFIERGYDKTFQALRVRQFMASEPARRYISTMVLVILTLSTVQFSAAKSVPSEASTANPSGRGGKALPSLTEILGRLRASTEQTYVDLTHFVCKERIERYRGEARNPHGHKIDVIMSQVIYDHDSEQYTDLRQNGKPLSRIDALSGAWSHGEYGTVLRETINGLNSRAVNFVSFSVLGGKRAAVYTFDYGVSDSPWDILVAGTHYKMPFHCQIWASVTTGALLRIERITHDVPSLIGISAVNWAVEFGSISVNGKVLWLPHRAIYSVSYPNCDCHYWNQIQFSEYRRREMDFSKGWTEVSRHDLQILGDIRPNRFFKMITQLEDTHRVLELLARVHLQRPVRVYALGSTAEYDLCRPTPWMTAFSIQLPSAHYIILGPQAGDQAVVHEYVHALMHDTFHHLPFWLNEGIADFYSTIEPSRDSVKLGAPPEGNVEYLERFGLPLHVETLMKAPGDISDVQIAQGVYAESWLLVDMLSLKPEYSSQFSQFLAMVSQGQDPEQLFRRLWNKSSNSIDDDLRNYLNSHRISTKKVYLPDSRQAEDSSTSVVERGDWQSLYTQLLLLLQQYWQS